MQPSLESLIPLVKSTVREVLVDRKKTLLTRTKDDGSVVTEIDFEIQSLLITELKQRWPKLSILGEEMSYAEHVRVLNEDSAGVWAIDPLDGTTNFSSGLPLYATSVALVIDSKSVLGVVYDPNRDECFSAEAGKGAYLNGTRLSTHKGVALRQAIANVDYKRLVGRLAARLVQSPPYRSQRNLGTSVLEWCWLAAGRYHVYLHGGQKLWDYAAGSLILQEAGGEACCLDGSELDCRSMAKRSVVAAADMELFQAWSAWVALNLREALRHRSNN